MKGGGVHGGGVPYIYIYIRYLPIWGLGFLLPRDFKLEKVQMFGISASAQPALKTDGQMWDRANSMVYHSLV